MPPRSTVPRSSVLSSRAGLHRVTEDDRRRERHASRPPRATATTVVRRRGSRRERPDERDHGDTEGDVADPLPSVARRAIRARRSSSGIAHDSNTAASLAGRSVRLKWRRPRPRCGRGAVVGPIEPCAEGCGVVSGEPRNRSAQLVGDRVVADRQRPAVIRPTRRSGCRTLPRSTGGTPRRRRRRRRRCRPRRRWTTRADAAARSASSSSARSPSSAAAQQPVRRAECRRPGRARRGRSCGGWRGSGAAAAARLAPTPRRCASPSRSPTGGSRIEGVVDGRGGDAALGQLRATQLVDRDVHPAGVVGHRASAGRELRPLPRQVVVVERRRGGRGGRRRRRRRRRGSAVSATARSRR